METIFSVLFSGKLKYLPSIVGALNTLLVKNFGLGLQNPVMSSNEKYLSSCHAGTELIRDVKREIEFSTVDHLQVVKKEISDRRNTFNESNKAKLEGIVDPLDAFEHCLFLRAKKTGSWMTIRGSTVTRADRKG